MFADLKHLGRCGVLLLLLLPSTARSDATKDLRKIAKDLESKDEEVVRLAFESLRGLTPATMGEERGPVLKGLLKRVSNRDTRALFWLGEFGPESKEGIPAMLDLLRYPGDPDASRLPAADCLAKMGKLAVPGLIETLQTKYLGEWSRIYAAEALAKIGADAAPAVPVLLELRMHWDPQVRTAGGDAVVKLGPHAVPGLIEALKSDDDFIRGDAVVLLFKIGLPAKKALPRLQPLRSDDSRFVREVAAWAIARLSALEDKP